MARHQTGKSLSPNDIIGKRFIAQGLGKKEYEIIAIADRFKIGRCAVLNRLGTDVNIFVPIRELDLYLKKYFINGELNETKVIRSDDGGSHRGVVDRDSVSDSGPKPTGSGKESSDNGTGVQPRRRRRRTKRELEADGYYEEKRQRQSSGRKRH